MNRLGAILLELIIIAIVWWLLAYPFRLAMQSGAPAEDIAEIAKLYIPGIVVILIVIILNQGIQGLLQSATRTFDRVTSVSLRGTTAALAPTQNINVPPTLDKSEGTSYLFDAETHNIFYLQYVYLTIFGSQYELLTEAQKGPISQTRINEFYKKFQSRYKGKDEYPF